MPIINPKDNGSSSHTRTTFRPPWVKDTPNPLPMPTVPWTSKAREINATNSECKNLRKENQDKGCKNSTSPSACKVETEIGLSRGKNQQKENLQASSNIKNIIPSKNQTTTMQSTSQLLLPPPPPPPPPPPAPAPAPSVSLSTNNCQEQYVKKPPSKDKLEKLEALRSRPRRRPDWSDMMKEVESGKQLKHIQCNDRSAPVLPQMKAKGQFVYESEKKEEGTSRNKLLKEIQSGIKLKKVKCHDRSKPNLDGLRKFRRQMTIEEQIQKSVSMADVVAAVVEPDELDDIDKVRDDLQSAKQMLALELRNKEAVERENKRLLARLTNLEAELEKEKSQRKAESQKGHSLRTEEDEKLLIKLKDNAAEADRVAKEMEQKYHATAEQLDNVRRKLESAWLTNQELEQQLKSMAQATSTQQLIRQPSKKFIPIANGSSVDLISDDEDDTETETEEETEIEETHQKQIARELKLLTSKLRTFREKQCISMKERRILKEQLKKRQNELKEEKSKYKLLQKEVEKMAQLMREADEEDCLDEESENDEESESDSESEESEEEVDEEIPYNASVEEKRSFLLERTKKHENRLSSLKKGNNLLKANIERLQDDINKQREMSLLLQEDLNNVLDDLG